jgi:hypothetical protein
VDEDSRCLFHTNKSRRHSIAAVEESRPAADANEADEEKGTNSQVPLLVGQYILGHHLLFLLWLLGYIAKFASYQKIISDNWIINFISCWLELKKRRDRPLLAAIFGMN